MKKLKLALLMAAVSLSGSAFAAGYHANGNVQVYVIGSNQYMQANMSVRYNTSTAGRPYVLANGYANSTVTFAGRDAQNEYFSCVVTTSSPLYDAAVAAKNNMQDGSRLYVYKPVNSNTCTNFSLGQYSYYIE